MTGFIYFIQHGEDDLVKVGFSRQHPAKRLAQLQTGCPTVLHLSGWLPGGPETEKQFHARFAAERVRGEWFRLSGRVFVEFLNACEHFGRVRRGEVAR